ncbi:MAG TPA: prepilin-type N-terminal cleavage/methylation domain-containing protein [Dehalococcoidales bacterium]|nr:prepilin-type N-terminal cleavage/methylation domain-containing protein [Dehalococcoidales bacterium]
MKGLSLIEILIYITLLAVLAAVVIPNLSRLLEW